MEDFITSNNTFAVNMYKKLSEHADNNIFFSPMSIASALAMILPGANGNTEFQIANVLNLQKPSGKKGCRSQISDGIQIQNVPQIFKEFSSSINEASNSYTMTIANRLFSEKSFQIIEEYSQLLEKYFQAEVQAVDFLQAAETSRTLINNWVEKQTDGKIKDILAPGSIDSLTKMVLVNAIYFKGNWNTKFPEENTEQKPFKMSKTKSKLVPMMFQRNKFNISYIEELETKVLELPYVDNKLSMILLLPDEIKDNSTGLEKLEKELNYEKLKAWTNPDMMDKTEVELELPRILLEENYDLKSYLTEMGLGDLFNADKADLTGISKKGNIYISKIVHKAFVKINEEGTEATAATAAVVTIRSRPVAEKYQFDHPFVFFIRDNKSGAIIFLGKYSFP
ncbi:leukocyte elastase inhibitor-like [Bufo bufo]|uniref:leukocyte elastase inhibitor-like n=1 Tax=Bufo bufo TaxID=8384 RepID=UPI001ABDC86D|nr:leukocyte elastase inhibitor-like [Bufo bufo]